MSSLDTAPLRGGVSFGRWACALFVAQNKEHRAVGERYMGGPLDRLTLQAPLSPQPLPGFTNPVTVRKSPGGGFRLGATAAVNWPGPLQIQPLRMTGVCAWMRTRNLPILIRPLSPVELHRYKVRIDFRT